MTQFRFQGLISARLSPDTPNGDADTVRHGVAARQGGRIDPPDGERLYSRLLRSWEIVTTEIDDGGVAKW
jgi:hypothetical protein